MLTMIYMTRILNMSFFLLKVNNPFVRHPIWPRRAPVGHFVWPPVGHPFGPVWPSVWPPRLAIPVWPPRLAIPVWPPRLAPRQAPRLAPHLATRSGHTLSGPVGHPSGRRRVGKKKKKIFFFWLLLPAGKEGKKYFSFRFSIPKIPEFPELRERSREKKKVFLA
jgi:hypothetical protein